MDQYSEELRADTPGTASVIHLNNSGASLPVSAVVEAMIAHLQTEQRIGPYEAAVAAADQAKALYQNAAMLIGCTENEIAFCDSATRAWNSIVYSLPLRRGDRVLTSALEFGSCLIALQHAAERAGAVVEIIPSDSFGRIDLNAFRLQLAARQTAVVAVAHAAAHSGAVNPVSEVGSLTKEAGALFLVDACQSVGQLRVLVDEIHCDALAVTGRKWLRGPRGTGFLYVRNAAANAIDPVTSDLVTGDYLLTPNPETGSRIVLRSDARKFELWERSIAGAIGLGVAIDYLNRLIAQRIDPFARIHSLAQRLVSELGAIPGVDLWGPDTVESGVVGFSIAGRSPVDVKMECARSGINISTMSDYDAPLDFARRGAKSVCRAAPHYFNTPAEVDRLLAAVRQLAKD